MFTCFGLFGIALYAIELQKKEIGIWESSKSIECEVVKINYHTIIFIIKLHSISMLSYDSSRHLNRL